MLKLCILLVCQNSDVLYYDAPYVTIFSGHSCTAYGILDTVAQNLNFDPFLQVQDTAENESPWTVWVETLSPESGLQELPVFDKDSMYSNANVIATLQHCQCHSYPTTLPMS